MQPSRCLTYLAQCESQYSSAKIRRHNAVAWAVVGWLLLTGKVRFEDDELPASYINYDNDVSINGGRGT